MTPSDPDAILDARLAEFFAARAERSAAQAPSAEDAAVVLARRLLAGGKRDRPSFGRPSMGTGMPRRLTLATTRYAAVVIAAALVIVVAALLAGTGSPRPAPSPTPSAYASATVAAVAPSSSLYAPLGYPGTGVIEFTRHNDAGEDDLWLIDPSGNGEELLVPGGCCGLFSPDGRLLAVAVPDGGLVTKGSGHLGINVYPQPGNVADGTIPGYCGACVISTLDSEPDAWSPNGTQVAIALSNEADPTQDGMAIAGDPPHWVYGTGALGPGDAHTDIPIAFSPDGKMLLFMRQESRSGPTSTGPLFVLTISDRSARRLTPQGMTVSANGLIQGPASWTPDGTIVFAATDPDHPGNSNIYATGPSADAKLETVVPDVRGATSAHVSPDGKWIAYDVPGAGGLHDLHVVHPDGTGDRNLTADFDPGTCCGQWSPDSDALLVPATPSDDTHYDLFVVPLDGAIRQVTQHPNSYTGFLWGRRAIVDRS
jgi:hypothetical protein